MAGKVNVADITQNINSLDDLEKKLVESEDKCVIIDVYQVS